MKTNKSLILATLCAALGTGTLGAAPLKVYLMSGQSNMQGYCAVHTFPQIEEDPATRPIYEKMVNPDGTPRVHKDVWISTLGCANDAQPGQLTAGYGAGHGDRIGPELTFGIYMQEHAENTGKYYRMMIDHAKTVRGDIGKVYPGYAASQGYEIAGFVWFQGENDFGGDSYPNAGQPGGFDEYTRLLPLPGLRQDHFPHRQSLRSGDDPT